MLFFSKVGDGNTVVPVKTGEKVYLERSLIDTKDPRCSRKQVEVVGVADDHAMVTALGINVSSLVKHNDINNSPVPLVRGEATKVEVGDTICLLGEEHRFVLKKGEPGIPQMFLGVKRAPQSNEEKEEKEHPRHQVPLSSSSSPPQKRPEKKASYVAPKANAWNAVFYGIMKNPSAHPDAVVSCDDSTIVIRDKYAKSAVHLLGLLMPPERSPKDPRELRKSHLPALRAMHAVLKGCVDAEIATRALTGERAHIRYGFHMAPSMLPMHLHGISQDFDSPALKRAKHWNSFTTDFFVPYETVVETLDKADDDEDSERRIMELFGSAKEAEKKYFGLPLRCHVCHTAFKNMPSLKAHIKACVASLERAQEHQHDEQSIKNNESSGDN